MMNVPLPSSLQTLPPKPRIFYWLFKRCVDVMLASLVGLLTLPVWLVCLFLPGICVQRTVKTGYRGTPYEELSFTSEYRWFRFFKLHRLPVLWNILTGRMSWIGPRSLTPQEAHAEGIRIERFAVPPGLVCLHWIRSRANIDYQSEWDNDVEYVETAGPWRDTAIAFRSLAALFLGSEPKDRGGERILFTIRFQNWTMAETLAAIRTACHTGKQKQLCFVNPDCINIAFRDAAYWEILRHADWVLADGIGMKIAGKILAQPFRQNVNGTDLFPLLCRELQNQDIGMYLLGGRPGVAEKVKDWIQDSYPGVKVSGARDGYYRESEENEVVDAIRRSGASILLVAMGVPKQEMWIHRRLRETNVSVAMGVGGLFDFYSGRIPRAPIWMREIGLEWFYRFYQEPGRLWKRYFIGNFVFLYRVLRERVTPTQPHSN